MKTFIADTEYSEKGTLNKWKGLFPDSNSFNQIIFHKEDFQIVKPERNIFGEYAFPLSE